MPYTEKVLYLSNWRTIYISTRSRHPIIRHGELRDDARRGFALWTDIRLDADTIRFINVHLQSVRLAQEIDILDSKLEPGLYKDPEFRRDAKSLLRKLKRAFVARSHQSRELSDFIEASPYPVVISGDLNDTPASYTYRILNRSLSDAFRKSGNGAANTYSGRFPSFRIDYMMNSPVIKSYRYNIHRIRASDHYPLSMDISMGQ
jgi:endonuclease/exonuclease/phosphatase family metal-dependent hydrolase